MSKLRVLDFQYNLQKKIKPIKMLSMRDRQASDVMLRFEPNEKEMKQVFDKLSNNKERIEVKDLEEMLQKFRVCHASSEAKNMMSAADLNKDGHLDFAEFMEMHKKSGISISEIKRAFWMFDEDRDGRISATEMLKMLERLGEKCSLEDCKRMVKHVDKNGDGVVDMDEFVVMMTSTMKPI